MIDFNLIDEPINIENFTVPAKEEYPMLVLGSIIRNEYDKCLSILIDMRSILYHNTTPTRQYILQLPKY